MKKIIISVALVLTGMFSFTSCLDTQFNGGTENIDNVEKVKAILTGSYYDLSSKQFCGTWGLSAGDIMTNITGTNPNMANWVADMWNYTYDDNSATLLAIWQYGYKTINLASQVNLYAQTVAKNPGLSSDDLYSLKLYRAEALGLRAASYLYLMNYFCLPYKVNAVTTGTHPHPAIDNGKELGLVIEDHPISVYDHVQRSTIAETYAAVFKDLKEADALFSELAQAKADGKTSVADRGFAFINPAAIHGFMARAYLYSQDYDNAAVQADLALKMAGSPSLISTVLNYSQAYSSLASQGGECIFADAVDATTSLTSESPGTLWTSYGYQPGTYMKELVHKNDVDKVVDGKTVRVCDDIRSWLVDDVAYSGSGTYLGGKFFGLSGNSEIATVRLMNAPEMYLIKAEAELLSPTKPDLTKAEQDLLTVAHARNADVTSVGTDVPSVLAFLKDERGRELFQEGHRYEDLRRWGDVAQVYEQNSDHKTRYNDFQIYNCVCPIPKPELNSRMGVVQNPNWQDTKPVN